MIELPEAVTLARQLNEALPGKGVVGVVAGQSPHAFAWFHGDPSEYPQVLIGTRVEAAGSDGGFVHLRCGDAALLFAEGVNLRLHQPGDVRPKKHQLLLELCDGVALSATVQMYGGVWAFRRGTFENAYHDAAKRAPSPLSDAFDRPYFDRIVAAPDLQRSSVKALLATEQRVPGLGNGVLQDILYNARIHPRRRVASLDANERHALFDSLTRTLAEMARRGGRDTERDLYGYSGGYSTRCSRHTLGTSCGRCGSTIVKAQYLGGAVYLCPGCQPLA